MGVKLREKNLTYSITMNTAIIIVAIIQIITLIVFFVMASNIGKIKNHLLHKASGDDFLAMASLEEYLGNKEKAREHLLRAKYRIKTSENEEEWDATTGKYENRLDKIDKKLSEL